MKTNNVISWEYFKSKIAALKKNELRSLSPKEIEDVLEHSLTEYLINRGVEHKDYEQNNKDLSKIHSDINLIEEEDRFVMECLIPGIMKEYTIIEVTEWGMLRIKGYIKITYNTKFSNYITTFEKEILLPKNCDWNNINYFFINDILTLNFVKKIFN